MWAKIQFKNLLSLVNELKAKNELLKKELRSKDKIISLLENKCLNKNKNGIRDKKNIYDIAGSLLEWTLEKSSTYTFRSGYFSGPGSAFPASGRGNSFAGICYRFQSFTLLK